MNATSLPHLKIAFVATRDLSQLNGRTPIQGHIIRSLRRHHRLEVLHLRSVMQTRQRRDVIGAAFTWIKSVLSGHPLPLQCLLYGAPSEAARLTAEIRAGDFDAVYLDTVRCQILLRELRRELPDLHVVADFDDLMSRRAAFLARNNMPFLSGHVGPHFPRWLRWVIEVPLARLITAYEALTLPAAEREVVGNADMTVLLSGLEAKLLEQRTGASVRAILPGIYATDAQVALLPEGAYTLEESIATRIDEAVNTLLEGALAPRHAVAGSGSFAPIPFSQVRCSV